MRIQFVERRRGPGTNVPDNLVCDAELVLVEGHLAGCKIVGFGIWKGKDGAPFVTFPARAWGKAGERKFFDFIQTATDGDNAPVSHLKEWILGEYTRELVNQARQR